MIIQSVERAFAILEYLTENGGMARLNDIANALEMQKTTVHNLLDTLKKLGYVDQSEESPKYFITSKSAKLHGPICSTPEIKTLVEVHISELAKNLGETTFLAIQSGSYYHYDLVATSEGITSSKLELGRDEEMFRTAVGKLFIAFSPSLEKSLRKYYPGTIDKRLKAELEVIRKNRFAIDLEAYVIGQNCIAIPIFHRQHIIAVLGAFGPSIRFNRNAIDRAIILFTRASEQIRAKIEKE